MWSHSYGAGTMYAAITYCMSTDLWGGLCPCSCTDSTVMSVSCTLDLHILTALKHSPCWDSVSSSDTTSMSCMPLQVWVWCGSHSCMARWTGTAGSHRVYGCKASCTARCFLAFSARLNIPLYASCMLQLTTLFDRHNVQHMQYCRNALQTVTVRCAKADCGLSQMSSKPSRWSIFVFSFVFRPNLTTACQDVYSS